MWILSSNPGTVALDSQPINQAHSLKPSPGDAASGESLTRDEVAKHTTKEEGLWVIINDQVYDGEAARGGVVERNSDFVEVIDLCAVSLLFTVNARRSARFSVQFP